MTGGAALTVHLAPLAEPLGLGAVVAAGFALLALSAILFRRGLFWRGLCLAVFLLFLLNPSFVEERREPVPDVAVIVADRSPSQRNGDRAQTADQAVAYLKQKLQGNPALDLRVVDAPAAEPGIARETRLFEAADRAYADIPLARRAGTVFVTDGQVHDAPQGAAKIGEYGPVHALLTGRRGERDRQLVVSEAPAYGIVGQNVTIRYRVVDTKGAGEAAASVTVSGNGRTRAQTVPVNQDQEISVAVDHAGQNVFSIEASPLEGEITPANNRVPVIVNGVRDRLRVLLVSGQPHAGGRTWRDMLTSDPGVDLVHFTILREPDKLDATPQNELSLIAFPFRELFEVKLYDFDLIIFDRYKLNRILPNYYFANIARYVQEGGALLEASGPSFNSGESIFTTALGDLLPAAPTGEVVEQPFRPALTETGRRHPVTQNLQWRGENGEAREWGRWLRQIAVAPRRGEVVMSGANGLPLLILDRVGKGRVAQLASDQIWLWSRGYDGGGPNTELLRRLAHWLMKEPELEENALDATVDSGFLRVVRHTLGDAPMEVSVTAPDGTQAALTLAPSAEGVLEGRMPADQLGIYAVKDGEQIRYAISGDLNPPELRAVVTTPDVLAPVAKATGGTVLWLHDTPRPDVRLVPPGRNYGGRSWLGLRSSGSYNVTGVMERPLLPMWGWALILLGTLIAAWWMEGRSRK